MKFRGQATGIVLEDDTVNHPKHYPRGDIEYIGTLKAATSGLEGIQAVCAANAIKYIWRFKYKNGVEDLDKAIWYINKLKEELIPSAERGDCINVEETTK